MFERHFDLDGCRVRVRAEGEDLARVVDLLLSSYSAAPASDVDVDVSLARRSSAPAAPAGPPRFTFPPLGAWPVAGGWRFVDDVAALDVHAAPRGATIDGEVASDAPMEAISRFAGLSLWVALIECLRARGRYPLHAAGLIAPDGRVVLVPGTKGAGKSTLTLALIERGFSVLSDDTLFVERRAGGIALIGYRKRFHVRPDLLERRPDLAPLVRRPRTRASRRAWSSTPARPRRSCSRRSSTRRSRSACRSRRAPR
jgi:hypothetical protein